MKRTAIQMAVLAVVSLLSIPVVNAQNCGGYAVNGGAGCVGYNFAAPGGGTTQIMSPVCPTSGRQYPTRIQSVRYGLQDHYSPDPRYTYSRNGIDAARMNEWNQSQMAICPWQGGYSYWRWNQPTALVVPPTAAFQSEYNWGVAQTRSIPIYHQFGTGNAGMIGGGGAGFSPTPYWPSSTSQFGIYPVRGPWH
jgi:hypothetical protein